LLVLVLLLLLLLLLQRVYQYAKDKNTQVIKEEHTLGTYDRAATAAAAVNDKLAATRHPEIARAWAAQWKLQQAASKHSAGAGAEAAAGAAGGEKGSEGKEGEKAPPAPPMLELLDYLPDTGECVGAVVGGWGLGGGDTGFV
jgi:hypothetical protein